MFPTIRIDRNRAEAVEPLGTKRKFWFSEKNKRMLFKAEERGTGEDWAEKLACELCRRIGLPHVEYAAAKLWRETIRGVTGVEIEAIIEEVPANRMSEVARRFTLALILANQERILNL
jgi:hypothetical protein